jgi:branched-chain amino acid transport system substrate-binding protein
MFKNSRVLLSIAMISALGATVIACSSSGTGSGNPGASSKPIKIGGTLGLTGSLSITAVEYKEVYDFWAKKVNAAGGLLGRRVSMDIKNDNSTAATAQSLYQTLISSDRVDLLLGPYATFVGVPVVPIARAANKVLFNGGFVGLQYFNQADGWMVGTYTYQEPDYSRGVFDSIASLPADQRPTKVAILTNNTPFTLVARDGYKGEGGVVNNAKKANMKVVFNETYSSTTTDFTAAIQRAKSAGADLFFVLGMPNDSDNIIKTEHVLGYQPKITCACGAQATTLPNWTQLGSATEGVVGTTVAWPTQKNNGAQDVESFSQSRGEKVVPAYDYVAYSVLQVLQQAVEGAKTLDQNKLKNYIHSHTFDTAVGKIKYQANGTPNYSEVITQTVKGVQQPIWPANIATAKLALQ